MGNSAGEYRNHQRQSIDAEYPGTGKHQQGMPSSLIMAPHSTSARCSLLY